MEEHIKSLGFESIEEFNHLVASLDLSNPVKLAKFMAWKNNDGTKEKLLEIINGC